MPTRYSWALISLGTPMRIAGLPAGSLSQRNVEGRHRAGKHCFAAREPQGARSVEDRSERKEAERRVRPARSRALDARTARRVARCWSLRGSNGCNLRLSWRLEPAGL